MKNYIKKEEKLMKEKYKEKLKSVGGKARSTARRIGSETKDSIKRTFLNLQYRMDQHIKISKIEKDMEILIEKTVEREKDHFKDMEQLKKDNIQIQKEHSQEVDVLDVNIILLTRDKAELKIEIAALKKALERMSSNLINTKADLIILKKEYGIE